MRRQLIVIALALFLVGGVALSADEAVLIDFSLLKADIVANPANQGVMTQNRGTMMDFSVGAGASFTDEQKAQMRTSLAIGNWDVELSSSSKTLLNQSLSETKEATVAAAAKQFAGKTVFGVRVHFPIEPFNSWAKIVPPFEIPAFEKQATIDDQGKIDDTKVPAGRPTDPTNARLTRFEGSYDPATKLTAALGIVKNVGTIKSVAVTVRGLQFPHGLYVLLKDADGADRSLFMGYLNFDGWKTLTWDNPQYVTDVRNRELKVNPLYPSNVPYVRFGGFVIVRDGASLGGDFVTYFKEVRIIYDRAVLDPVSDINDEDVWKIINQREDERKRLESKAFGNMQVERFLESQKKAAETNFSTAK